MRVDDIDQNWDASMFFIYIMNKRTLFKSIGNASAVH